MPRSNSELRRTHLKQVMMPFMIHVSWAQMVGRLLGQSGAAVSDAAGPHVSPGDIGIICFHRAQESLFNL